MSVEGFLDKFVELSRNMPDRPFCWILGSGASFQSGIPTGGKLANGWLKQLYNECVPPKPVFEEWANEQNLKIKGFKLDNAAAFYPWIYQRRFENDLEAGYAFLENAMAKAEPSYGYSVLAQILASTPHRAVITTNFDNLIADALSIYTDAFPLVCGHESLTGYIRAKLRPPVIAKVHRDLLLSPFNEPGEINELSAGWDAALKRILENFTPIVLGYGGNDGSLMGFLKIMKPVNGGVYWCHLAGDTLNKEIRDLVDYHRGRTVAIAGFDEFMLQLSNKLILPMPIDNATAAHERRVKKFKEQFEALNKKLAETAGDHIAESARATVREAAAELVQRIPKEKDWWSWQLKADAEPDPSKKEALFREGLRDFPESAELTGNFAVFMKNTRKDNDEAERLYRKALELNSKDAVHTGNFANFMKAIRKDNDEAERLYRKAIELDSENVNNTENFALFMSEIRKNYDEAEKFYRKAIELDPENANNTGNFALFLCDIRKDYDEAERLYRKAIELDPEDANNTGNFANFMKDIRKDNDEAERLYRKAIELDPENAKVTGNFANFMSDSRKDNNEAERLYRKAIKLDPEDAINISNFALFMNEIRKDNDEAERLYRKAIELDPENAINTGNFALFMSDIRKDYDEAERLYRKVMELAPKNARAMNSLAWFLATVRRNYKESQLLARKAVDAEPDNGYYNDTLAYILWKSKKDLLQANRRFKRALELEKDNEEIKKNYADFIKEHPEFKK